MGQRRQQMARGRLIFLAVVLVSLAQRSTSKALPPNPNPTQTPTATSTPTSTPTDPAEICSICTDACPTHLANYKKMNCCWSMTAGFENYTDCTAHKEAYNAEDCCSAESI